MSRNKMTRNQFSKTSAGLTILPSINFGSSLFNHFVKHTESSFSINEHMNEDYEIGLHILKPTKAQLEHGLELHRNSVIFDTYGFMPTAAIDGASVADAINNNASVVELKDMQENMRQTRYVDSQEEREEFENAWKASGVTCVFQNAAYSANAINKLIKRVAHFTYATDQMKAIADTDGYIGICCIPRFLGGTGDISASMNHIYYVVKHFGSDYVGIGTDVGYRSKYNKTQNAILAEKSTKPAPTSRTRFAALWPDEPFDTKPKMVQSMAWTNWPLFTVGMVQMGYSDRDIQKILGGNAIRVTRAALA